MDEIGEFIGRGFGDRFYFVFFYVEFARFVDSFGR